MLAVPRAITMVICANPSLRGVLVEVPAARVIAPVDVRGFPRQTGPGHAALIPVHAQVPGGAAHPVASGIYLLVYVISQEEDWIPTVSSSAERSPALYAKYSAH